jgi:hypothetical protein
MYPAAQVEADAAPGQGIAPHCLADLNEPQHLWAIFILTSLIQTQDFRTSESPEHGLLTSKLRAGGCCGGTTARGDVRKTNQCAHCNWQWHCPGTGQCIASFEISILMFSAGS